MMHPVCDSRGKPSWNLTLALVWTTLFGLWFVLGGINLEIAGLHIITATKSGADYALVVGPWIAAFGFREYIEKVKGGNTNSQGAG